MAAIAIPGNIKVEASGDYGDPGVDHDYIYEKTKSLSDTVFDPESKDRGREFGEPGEKKAAEDIKEWMENIGLEDVHNETIDATWDSKELNKKMQFTKEEDVDYFLKVRVINKITQEVEYNRDIECFPFLKASSNGYHYMEENDVRVVKRFKWLWPCNQIVLIDAEWAPSPWSWFSSVRLPWIKTIRAKGFILIDDPDANTNTRFMGPSLGDNFIKPGFSINHTDGEWIRGYLDNPLYKVVAHIKSNWEHDYVDSYNVIGQINGTDTGNVSIVCAHYDCWWNQGTIDEAVETALVLGIAKYMKDKNLKLKHTVKFIAFGGEEYGFLGAKDYIEDHPNENIKYVINPGNFGHEDKYYYNLLGAKIYLTFDTPSDNLSLRLLVKRITDALEYEDRTGIDVNWLSSTFGAEDSKVFSDAGKAEGSIQFARWPYKGYHRDGSDHTEGDIMDILDNSTSQVECEVVASVALHLTVDSDHQFENVSVTPFDSSNNGNNDSVNVTFDITTDTNTPLFGRVKGCLYNANNQKVSLEKKSGFYLLKKNEIETGYLTLRLPFCQPAGDYKVRLSVMDYWDEVDDEYNETVYLHPYSKPDAYFYYTSSSSKTRNFYDVSTPSPNANIVSWNWSFGDGYYSNEQNTSHTYADNGTYDVTLTVWDSNNLSDNIPKSLTVDNDLPGASFNVKSNVMCIDDSISFSSTSYDSDGAIVNWTWEFGDGNLSYSENPTHSYSKSSLYTVNLTVTDDDNMTNITTKTMVIAGAIVDDSFQRDEPERHRWNSIQEGINDVQDGNIVYISSGDYSEGITIDKSISLYGEDNETVSISSEGTVVDIQNDSVVMDGFTVTNGNIGILVNESNNCTIINCIISDSYIGIKINRSNNNSVFQCNLSNNNYGVFISGRFNWIGSQSIEQPWDDCMFTLNTYAIYLDHAQYNTIMGCTIDASPKPGHTSLVTGICFDDSHENIIAYCEVFNASNYGVYLDDSIENYVCHCLIRENNKGVHLTSSSGNRIAMNNISYNSQSGVAILMMSSSDNTINWNDFIENGGGVYPQASDDGSGNNWNTAGNETLKYVAAGEGNYWSDYNGSDNDGDGIGDTPYEISGTADAEDSYPVMEANDFFKD